MGLCNDFQIIGEQMSEKKIMEGNYNVRWCEDLLSGFLLQVSIPNCSPINVLVQVWKSISYVLMSTVE